jgi:hypothetical protein
MLYFFFCTLRLDKIAFITKNLLLSRIPQPTFIFLFYLLHILGKFFKIYTNEEEIVDVLTNIIKHMKHTGAYPTIKDVEQYYEDAQVMIARERIQICLNVVHSGVDITHRKTSIDYAIDLLPEIKAILMTTTTTVVVEAEPALEQKNDSLSLRSSLSSSATAVARPPSNDDNTKFTKRTQGATTNSSSTQINECPTPVAKRLRERKQIINDVRSPPSNTKSDSTTRDINTSQASTSSSDVNGSRKKKRSSKSIILAVCNDPEPTKKVKKRRQN